MPQPVAGIIEEATDSELEALVRMGRTRPLFQITDVFPTLRNGGKLWALLRARRPRSKATTLAYGIETAHRRAELVHQEACAVLEEIDRPTEPLRVIADYILRRKA